MGIVRAIQRSVKRFASVKRGTPRDEGSDVKPVSATTTRRQIPPANRQQHLRWVTHSRWFVVDQFERRSPAPEMLHCRICDSRRPTPDFRVLESYCRFAGGRLVRYQCPECDTIFGPLKVLQLSEAELGEEYRLLYEMYSEHDTSHNEIRTFHAMKPRRDGVYLNFGCGGAWNSAISQLRADGWNLFGFEPYAANATKHVIRSLDQLKQMKFDGIMSNNLLEHLTNPLETFDLWRSLLKNDDSVMAHSTPCYEYCYEFTRFHLFFFPGRSIDRLCQRVGLSAETVEQDGEYCCVRFHRLAAGNRRDAA